MNNTYILLARSLLDSEVFASQKMLKIWVWCLLKANYKDRKVPLKVGRGERTITVKRGQFLFGRFKAEDELFIDGSTIYKIMKKLEELGNISIKSNNQYSIITICNYDTYQDPLTYKVTTEEQPSNNRVTTKEQPSNTYNKDKNIKNYKEWISQSDNSEYIYVVEYILGNNPLQEPLDYVLKLEGQITEDVFNRLLNIAKDNGTSITDKLSKLDEKLTNSKGKGYVNLSKTLHNWLKNNFNKR